MSARVEINSHRIIDDIDLVLKRVGSRVGALATMVRGADDTARLAAAAARLVDHMPELRQTTEALYASLAEAVGQGEVSQPTAAILVDAYLSRGDLDTAMKWADTIADSSDPDAVLALARVAAATGDDDRAARAAEALASLPEDDDVLSTIKRTRIRAVLAGEEHVAAARDTMSELVENAVGPGGAVSRTDEFGSDPVAQMHWIELASEMYLADGHVKYLDYIETSSLNQMLFETSDDGAGITGRTLEGENGTSDDSEATPALARSVATVIDRIASVEDDGALVVSRPVNAVSTLTVGGDVAMRCIWSTQLPVRGWSSWVFEPDREETQTAPSVTTTRRTARRQRPGMTPASDDSSRTQDKPHHTFIFRVRVPKWAADAKIPPFVKVDGERANVKRSRGFFSFEIATSRTTRIEVTFSMTVDLIDRTSAASWAREVAITYGPLLLTTTASLNPGEDVSIPLRIISELEDIASVADMRRRLPVIQARALGGGGRANRILFVPVSTVGGFAAGPGNNARITCGSFRTWNRWGR